MRLVDLHCDWLRQYATETTLYGEGCYSEVVDRVGRLDGYMLGVSASLLVCSRKPADWAGQAEPWRALGRMLVRYESEFAGRIIRDARDAERWRSAPADGLCWGMLGVAGFDFLVRQPDDLEKLPSLFERGVRLFQPIATSESRLGGSSASGDDRGLTAMGRSFLDRLLELSSNQAGAPRPILDLAGMNPNTLGDTLRWIDDVPGGRRGLLLTLGHGNGSYRDFIDASSVGHRCLRELRARGAVIGITPGLPGCETSEELKALVAMIVAIPFEGRSGFDGIAVGTDLLAIDPTSPEFGQVRQITRGIERSFDREAAAAFGAGNGRQLILRAVGAAESSTPEGT